MTQKLECMNFREENVPSFSKICNLSDDGTSGVQILKSFVLLYKLRLVIGKKENICAVFLSNLVSFRSLSVPSYEFIDNTLD